MRFGIKFLLAPERSIGKPAALCLCKESSGPWRCPGDRVDAEFGGFAAAHQGGSAGLRTALRGCLCLHWDTCAGTCTSASAPLGPSAAAPAGNRDENIHHSRSISELQSCLSAALLYGIGSSDSQDLGHSSEGGTDLDIDAAFCRHPLDAV